MTTYVRVAMIVAAQDQVLAQSIASGLAGVAGEGMWTTPCSPTGAAPATHYITEGPIDEQFAGLLGNSDATFALCQQAGLPITLDQITGLYARAVFQPDTDPFTLMGKVGVQLIDAGAPS